MVRVARQPPLTPLMEAGISDFPYQPHRAEPSESPFPPIPRLLQRSFALPSVLPYLRRSDTNTSVHMSAQSKPPLLTLKLSSLSLLDCIVYEEFTQDPFYTVTTEGVSTTITRAGRGGSTVTTALLKWPKSPPTKGRGKEIEGITIRMRGAQWRGGETLLRPGLFQSAPRRFNIPNYSQSMKWRKSGNSFWCTTSGVKGPIAVLEPVANSPARLKVYETLHDRYDARALDVHHGVSTLLLDYLIVTALLLVSTVEDYLVVRKFDDDESFKSPSIIEPSKPTSASQWRKILYGEPLFTKRSIDIGTPSPEAIPDAILLTPTSPDQVAEIAYGVPLFSSPRSLSSSYSSYESESDIDDDDLGPVFKFGKEMSRPPSPSAESVYFPVGNASAPSHDYLDPSFYGDKSQSPISPPSLKASSAGHLTIPGPRALSNSRKRRSVLPLPPVPPPRSLSTPPMNVPSSTSLSVPSSITRRPSLVQGARPLPQPPVRTVSSPPSAYSVQRSQTVRVGQEKERYEPNRQGGRSLPQTPMRNPIRLDTPPISTIRLPSPESSLSISSKGIDRSMETLNRQRRRQPPMLNTPPAYNRPIQ
ncbi:hypothetical protein BDN72DRAFT_143828 [Pluteus cervinus]|uniref:Uncharacterized protein n=1 Tax=Pluteus cervinus TaxID=181527 RepID=A0ACD3ALL4_9AGAR|nr:hypothetical protein BDN72DRAFT_143828 [Pluteus cervinus]